MKILFIIPIVLTCAFLSLFLLHNAQTYQKEGSPGFPPSSLRPQRPFTKDQSIPENSMAAFANAVEHGYGIELDIQLTKDKQLVVFHDHTLTRMCGIDLPVCEMTYEELQKCTLGDTEEKNPSV